VPNRFLRVLQRMRGLSTAERNGATRRALRPRCAESLSAALQQIRIRTSHSTATSKKLRTVKTDAGRKNKMGEKYGDRSHKPPGANTNSDARTRSSLID
jgi:hypothetical protein